MSGFQGQQAQPQIPPQVLQMLMARMAQQRQMQQSGPPGGGGGPLGAAQGMPGGSGPMGGPGGPMQGGAPGDMVAAGQNFSNVMQRGANSPVSAGPMNQQAADIALDRMHSINGQPTKYPANQPEGYPAPVQQVPGPQSSRPMTPMQMAQSGRFGDKIVAHMAPGEISIPPELQQQNPQLMAHIHQAFQRHGIRPSQFTAGSQDGSVNPQTGMQEFSLWSAILPVAGAALGSVVPGVGTMAGAAAGGAIGGAAGGAIDGQQGGGILLSGALGGAGGAIGAGALGGAASGAADAGAAGMGGGATIGGAMPSTIAPEAMLGAPASNSFGAAGANAAGALGSTGSTGAAGAAGSAATNPYGGSMISGGSGPMTVTAPGAPTTAPGTPSGASLSGGIQQGQPMSGYFGGARGGAAYTGGSPSLLTAGKIGMAAGTGAALGGMLSPPKVNDTGSTDLNRKAPPLGPANPNFNAALGNSNSSHISFGQYDPYAMALGQGPAGGGYNFYSPRGNGT